MAPQSMDEADADGASTPQSPDSSFAATAQRIAVALIGVGAVVALLSIFGGDVLPDGMRRLVPLLHLLVIALGAGCGYCAIQRTREIDAERWRVVADDTLTAGERSWAHKEADSDKNSAVRTFLLAPLAIGAALAYQLRVPDAVTLSDLLIATPMLGFGLGALLAHRRVPRVEAPTDI